MKKIFMLIAALMAGHLLHAQQFIHGTNVVSAGIGLGSSLGSFHYGSQTPALSLQYERGVWEVGGPGLISLGGYAGMKSYKYAGSGYSEKWGYTIIGIRSAYHYNGIHSEKFDLYGGLMLSYNIVDYTFRDDQGNHIDGGKNYGSAAGLSLYAGGRYFFTQHVAAYAELGYGVSYLTLGLAFKF